MILINVNRHMSFLFWILEIKTEKYTKMEKNLIFCLLLLLTFLDDQENLVNYFEWNSFYLFIGWGSRKDHPISLGWMITLKKFIVEKWFLIIHLSSRWSNFITFS